MFRQVEYAPGYYDIIWGRFDKLIVRSVIKDIVKDITIQDGFGASLTRVHWSKAWQTTTHLHITISLEIVCMTHIQYSKRTCLYFSNNIRLEIPFSELRDYKLTKLLS